MSYDDNMQSANANKLIALNVNAVELHFLTLSAKAGLAFAHRHIVTLGSAFVNLTWSTNTL